MIPKYDYNRARDMLRLGYQLHVRRAGKHRLYSKNYIVDQTGNVLGSMHRIVRTQLIDSGCLRLREQGKWVWDYDKCGEGTE